MSEKLACSAVREKHSLGLRELLAYASHGTHVSVGKVSLTYALIRDRKESASSSLST